MFPSDKEVALFSRSTDQKTFSITDTPSCKSCLHGVRVANKEGVVCAELCECVGCVSQKDKRELEIRAHAIQVSGIPPVFANLPYGVRSFNDVAPMELKRWLYGVCQSKSVDSIFLCGNVGTGKTHLASDCVKRFILATGSHGIYITAAFMVNTKRAAVSSSIYYRHRDDNEDQNKLNHLEHVVRHAGLLVIDEVRESLSKKDISIFEEFVDRRYQSGLPTMFISNHTFDAKTSYKSLTIQKVLGNRNGDRLRKAVLCQFDGRSKRGVRPPHSYTEDEIKEYRLPMPILSLKGNDRQILNWITRNPIFEPINRKEREIARNETGQLVYRDGIPVDAFRECVKTKDNVWQRGDNLIVTGPVLCGQDAKTYLACLHLLKEQHNRGFPGLSIRVTPGRLMEVLGMHPFSSHCKLSLQRSLLRISFAVINYADNLGRYWTGPLFNFVYQPDNSDGAFLIHFNKSMIIFYQSFEYCVMHKQIFDAKIGTDGVRMQMFLRSHTGNTFDRMDFRRWMEFLDKPVDKMDNTAAGKACTRRHRKRFAELIRQQIAANLLTPDSGIKRNGKVVLTVTPTETYCAN